MRFSVIIPTCNRHDEVWTLLQELEPALERDRLQIVIVDDSDEADPHPRAVDNLPNYIYDYHKGKRGAINCINIGIERATNDHIILLGDDNHIKDINAFLDSLEMFFTEFHYPIVGFRVIDRKPMQVPTWIANLAWWVFGLPFPETGTKAKAVRFTSLFAFDKSKMKLRFDPAFTGSGFNGESDFILSNEQKVLYEPSLEVLHDEIGLSGKSAAEKAHNHKVLLKKHSRLWYPKFLFYMMYLDLVSK